jgi:multiple sugar transport system substrate-binding protein
MMKMKLKSLIFIVVMALLIVSCTSATEEPTEPPAVEEEVSADEPAEEPEFTKTNLTVPSWWAPHEIEGAEASFQGKFKDQTGLDVKYEFIGTDFNAVVFTNLASDEPYDVITYNADYVPQYLEREVLMPLNPFIEADNYDLTNIVPSALEQWTYDGEIYGLTADMGSFHAYFNYELFEEAGLTPPKPTDDWTWDQLKDWCEALTVKDGDQIVQYGMVAGTNWSFEFWPYLTGMKVFDDELTKSNFADPKIIEAFDFYQGLMHDSECALKPGATQTGPNDIFLSGQAGILIDGTWQVGYLRSKKDEVEFKWDVGMLPHNGNADEYFVPNFTAGWVIPKNAQDPQASWEAMKWYAGDTFGEEVMFVYLSGLPTTYSQLEGAWYDQWPENPPEGLTSDFYGKMLEYGVPRQHIRYDLGSDINAVLTKLDLIYSNEEEPSELLPQMADEIDELLAQRPWNQ